MDSKDVLDLRLRSLGLVDVTYDRFAFRPQGNRCMAWSSICATASLIAFGDDLPIKSLGVNVGFACSHSPHNDTVAICSDTDLRLYDFCSGSSLKVIPLPDRCEMTADFPASLVFDQSAERLALGHGSNLYIFDLRTNSLIEHRELDVTSMIIDVDRDFNLYVVSDFDNAQAAFSISSYDGAELHSRVPITPMYMPLMSPDWGNVYLSFGSPYWRSEIRDTRTGKCRMYLPYSRTMLYCGNGNSVIQLIKQQDVTLGNDSSELNVLAFWAIPENQLNGILDVDSILLLLAGGASSNHIAIVHIPSWIRPNGRIDLVSISNLAIKARILTDNLAVNSVAMSPSGNFLVVSVDGEYSPKGELKSLPNAELFYVDLSAI